VGDRGTQPAILCWSFFWLGESAGEFWRSSPVSTVMLTGACIVTAGIFHVAPVPPTYTAPVALLLQQLL